MDWASRMRCLLNNRGFGGVVGTLLSLGKRNGKSGWGGNRQYTMLLPYYPFFGRSAGMRSRRGEVRCKIRVLGEWLGRRTLNFA
jgi:hypothetical protein